MSGINFLRSAVTCQHIQ